jgi:hypothetical protein
MDENRTERFTISVTPFELQQLDAYAQGARWSRSTAAAELIQRGLAASLADHLAREIAPGKERS